MTFFTELLESERASCGHVVFRGIQDKHWSMTDCISFNLMKREGMTDALTSDHHFEQPGFRILLGN